MKPSVEVIRYDYLIHSKSIYKAINHSSLVLLCELMPAIRFPGIVLWARNPQSIPYQPLKSPKESNVMKASECMLREFQNEEREIIFLAYYLISEIQFEE